MTENTEPPQWAVDLIDTVEENTERIEELANQKARFEARLGLAIADNVETNARRIEAMAAGTRRRKTAELNGDGRRFDPAWDDTFQIEKLRR